MQHTSLPRYNKVQYYSVDVIITTKISCHKHAVKSDWLKAEFCHIKRLYM